MTKLLKAWKWLVAGVAGLLALLALVTQGSAGARLQAYLRKRQGIEDADAKAEAEALKAAQKTIDAANKEANHVGTSSADGINRATR
jgi:hypothetical protein